jgi:histidinol dehydrogenase
MSIRIIKTDDPLNDPQVLAVRDMLREGGLVGSGEGALDVPAIVRDILRQVASEGDAAVVALTNKLDKANITPATLRVSAGEIAEAHRTADADFLALMRRVIANIREYQQHILIQAPPMLQRGGRRLGVRYTPIERVGIYVPGGRALYPSTVLMTAVPARVAGVKEIVMVSPPTGGNINPMALALAGELGITEVYRMGGAQALAALAYGTRTIRPVQKIVGPGNAFVAEAKRQLFGRVGIDSIAGPSEVLMVADETARADWVAADLLAQAEHDPGSAVLVTPSVSLAAAVAEQVELQVETLERAEATRRALEAYSAIIVTPDLDSACDVANDFATEHLQVITKDDTATLAKIRNAGAAFLGANTPVPLGDYYAGPSHVLPTGGTAKFFGPLSCNDFLKATSVIAFDAASVKQDADDVIDFATREGLTAHARAAAFRKKD